MADGPPTETTPPERPSWAARVRSTARRAATDAGARSRRTWAWLVTVSRGLRAWLAANSPTLWARLVAASRRLRSWLVAAARKLDAAATERALPPPPAEPVERRELAGPITVFARGHVFTFTVRAAFTWRAQGLRPDQLAWHAHHFMPQAIRRLTRIAAGLARSIPPHQAGELEVQLQRVLNRQGSWPFKRGGTTVTCRLEAWVRLDERVRQTLQPYWQRQIVLECRHEEFLRRARYAEQLNRRWSAILDDLVDADLPDVLREEVARVREHTLSEQRAAARWSVDLLRQRRPRQDRFEPSTEPDATPQPAPPPPTASAVRPTQAAPRKTPTADARPADASAASAQQPGRPRAGTPSAEVHTAEARAVDVRTSEEQRATTQPGDMGATETHPADQVPASPASEAG